MNTIDKSYLNEIGKLNSSERKSFLAGDNVNKLIGSGVLTGKEIDWLANNLGSKLASQDGVASSRCDKKFHDIVYHGAGRKASYNVVSTLSLVSFSPLEQAEDESEHEGIEE